MTLCKWADWRECPTPEIMDDDAKCLACSLIEVLSRPTQEETGNWR